MPVTNLTEFNREVDLSVVKVREDLWPNFYRLLVLTLLRGIVLGSPVRTGRFRGNNQVSIESLVSGVVDTLSPGPPAVSPARGFRSSGGGEAVNAALPEIAKIQGFETVNIGNNLPYVIPIEEGLSPQAPEGVYGVAVAEIEAWLIQEFRRLDDVEL